jgi:hypothetical protein
MIEYTFPHYKEGEKLYWNNDYNTIYRYFDENNYYKNVDEILETLEQLPKVIYIGKVAYQSGENADEEINMTDSIEKLLLVKEQVNKAINTTKMIKFIADGYRLIESDNNKILKFMPSNIKLKYEPIVNELNNKIKLNVLKDDKFIKDNVNELFAEIDKRIIILQNKLKESRKKANKKYYEKQKALMNTIKKPSKTPEEIMQSRKEANHKFYLKRKEILKDFKYIPKTDEEKLEAKKEANKKYYEKKKLQIQELES